MKLKQKTKCPWVEKKTACTLKLLGHGIFWGAGKSKNVIDIDTQRAKTRYRNIFFIKLKADVSLSLSQKTPRLPWCIGKSKNVIDIHTQRAKTRYRNRYQFQSWWNVITIPKNTRTAMVHHRPLPSGQGVGSKALCPPRRKNAHTPNRSHKTRVLCIEKMSRYHSSCWRFRSYDKTRT